MRAFGTWQAFSLPAMAWDVETGFITISGDPG
jgi:hypothetical protein